MSSQCVCCVLSATSMQRQIMRLSLCLLTLATTNDDDNAVQKRTAAFYVHMCIRGYVRDTELSRCYV